MKTTPEDLTEYAKQRALIASTQQEICERLRFTRDDLSQMMYEQGIIYLEEFHKDAPLMARLMEQDKVFWNWWKNGWHYRNEMFLRDLELCAVCLPLQRIAYTGYNNGKELVKLMRPTRVVYIRHLNTFKKAL